LHDQKGCLVKVSKKKNHIEGQLAWGSWICADEFGRGLELGDGIKGAQKSSDADFGSFPVLEEPMGTKEAKKESFHPPDSQAQRGTQNPKQYNSSVTTRKDDFFGKSF
jgi:hypothetical protein